MPAYNSQVISNSPLQSIGPEDHIPTVLLNAEIPTANPLAGSASIAVAIRPQTVNAGPRGISFEFLCPLGITVGVFQIQESDEYTPGGETFTSVNFDGQFPGVVNAAKFNTGGTAKITLQVRARFVRVLCITPPGNPVTVKVSG